MKVYISFIMAVLLFSCSGGDDIPDNVMKPDKMEQVLWDAFLAEAAAQQISGKDSTVVLSDKIKELTGIAFEINKVTDSEFFRSYNWYIKHPGIFGALLDSLYDRKSAREETVKPIDSLPGENSGLHKPKIERREPDSARRKYNFGK